MRYILNFSVSVLICALVLSVVPANGEEDIYTDVIRLHVIANSDSEEDQSLKLKVRDALVSYAADLLEDCDTKDDAEARFAASLDDIERVAAEVVAAEGFDCSVSAELGEENYPTLDYGDISLPSGTYTSLRVKIASGAGKNWWCVLFPPLCTSLALGEKKASEELCIETGLTPAEYRLITETDNVKYKLKFKFLEAIAELFEMRRR